jgi:hypothetical protein
LWTATAVTAIFSLEAGLAIFGDTLDVNVGGTSQVHAVSGDFANKNDGVNFAANMGGVAVTKWVWTAGGAAVASLTAAAPGATLIGVPAGTGTNNAVIYASEVFRTTTAPVAIPHGKTTAGTGSANYQTVCYTIPGTITNPFKVEFSLAGGPTFFNSAQDTAAVPTWFFGIIKAATDTPDCSGTPLTGSVSGAVATLSVTPAASCSLTDGTQICLAYKIAGATTLLKEPGKTVTMGATFKRVEPATIVTQALPIVVAESKQGANFGLVIESDGQAYVSASSGFREFVSAEAAGAVGANDTNAYMSTTQVKIGYVTYSATATKAVDGSAAFTIGGAGSTDNGTLVVKNGQFSASLANTAGRVFLGNLSDANAVVDPTTSTATWNLTATHLGDIATKQTAVPTPTAIPIIIRVDGVSEIKDTDEEPVGEITVKLGGTSPLTDTPVTSPLRKIPFDGKVCKVFNIPSPDGAADVLSLRITNDSDQPGKITGTLYNEAGELQGDNLLDLLAGHIDYTKNPPAARVSMGTVVGSDGVTYELLGPKETVILNSKNIATIFGQTGWAGERWVLEIQSSISKIEVFNLLRNVERVTEQPLSNISTSAKNAECSPIP